MDAGFLDPRYPTWRKQAGLPPDYWPGMNVEAIRQGYLDPEAFLREHLSPEPRFVYPAARFYLPGGRVWTSRGRVVVNLSRPDLAQIGLEEPFPT